MNTTTDEIENMPEGMDVLTLESCAGLLGISQQTLHSLIERGDGPPHRRLGNRKFYRFSTNAVMWWLARGDRKATASTEPVPTPYSAMEGPGEEAKVAEDEPTPARHNRPWLPHEDAILILFNRENGGKHPTQEQLGELTKVIERNANGIYIRWRRVCGPRKSVGFRAKK